MADQKISGLTAVVTPATTDEVPVNQAGASKKMTLAQLRAMAPTAPTFVAATAEFTSTGVPVATLPTGHALNDILVLVIQSSNDSQVAAPAGYRQLGPQNAVGVAATAGANRLSIFWKRDGGSESAPTIPDTGDHTYGMMFAIRGCPTTLDPFHFGINVVGTGSFTSGGIIATSVTSIDNTLVIDILSHGIDITTAQADTPTNTDLSAVTKQFDDSTTDGTGGGIVVVSGLKAAAGPVGTTNLNWSSATQQVGSRIHFIPADAYMPRRYPERWMFAGSAQDTDDKWTVPLQGFSKVLVQLCDGGGSGSGGNVTTTAAGGGGGGGGGYDEAWFDGRDFGADSTVTVHAGKGGAVGTALLQAGNAGVLSEFNKGNPGPLTSTRRIAGTAATAAAVADGGNGGCGSGRGTVALAAQTTRAPLEALAAANALVSLGGLGGRGGSGTTAPVGGSPAEWGGGGGESGADTDAGTAAGLNGYSLRGGGGGSSGRTNANISTSGSGGYGNGVGASQGQSGPNSSNLPYGGAGGVGGGSGTVTGGSGGFPGGGGGGGAGVAGGFGGAGGHGCIVLTAFFD